MKYPVVAQRITEAMAEKNLRAQDVANLSGINKASISQYVNGTNSPSNLTASKLSKVLGVSPMWLMGFDFDKNGKPKSSESDSRLDCEIAPYKPTPGDHARESKIGKIIVELSQMNDGQLDRLIKIMDVLKGGDDT